MNKLFLLSSCALMLTANVAAKEPSRGVDFFEAGMYQVAQRYFKSQPSTGESYYYLGEIAYILGKPDSAAWYYDRGLTASPPYAFCYVGKGKLLLPSNTNDADAMMQKAFADKDSRKDPAIYTAIGNAYAANKLYSKAMDYITQARNIDKNFVGSYIAEGDILMAENKLTDAVNKYDMAAYMDKSSKLARLKTAGIYVKVNPNQALVMGNELLAMDSNYAPAYKLLGDLYYDKGQMDKAGEAYARYISLGGDDVADHSRYASILFFEKDYRNSLSEVEKALAKDPTNQVMQRLLGYNLFEIADHGRALTAMTAFMNDPKNKHIASDYKYYARILQKNGQDSLSIENYTKALEVDSTNKSDTYKEMAQACESMKRYALAGLYYEHYLEIAKDAASTDYFYCGRNYYYAGGQMETNANVDSVERNRLLRKADHYFAIVVERNPESYIGNFWRARTQASLDPETEKGLAKPYYEKALAMLEADPTKYSGELQECYKYLGYYYFQKDDKSTSITYWNKVLTLAPDDPVAKRALKGLTSKDTGKNPPGK